MNMPWDEEELNRERVPQRSMETTLEDTGVPIALTVTAERYTLRRRRTSAAPPIFARRVRPFSRAAAEARSAGRDGS
jgi:hypothetical protein